MSNVHFSSATDLWATPREFFDKLNEEFGFEVDVCATPENAKCNQYFTKESDGLKQDWHGVCWMNPPYGREIGAWMKKAHESAGGGRLSSALSRRVQIRGGGMNTPSSMKSDLSKDGLNLATQKTALRFQAPWW